MLLQREVRRERARLDAAARSIQTCYRMYRMRQRHHEMIYIVRDVRHSLLRALLLPQNPDGLACAACWHTTAELTASARVRLCS